MRWVNASCTFVAIVTAAAPASWTAQIRLTDETEFTGEVVQTTDERVVIGIPRQAVAVIDGYPLPPVLAAGVEAPAFTAVDLAGQPVTMSKDGNGALTVLHFWVSWCPFCQKDAPTIQALHDAYKAGDRVRVLTVSLDRERAKLEAFVKERTVTYPVIDAAEQKDVDLPSLYQITGFPVTYLIDGGGVIRHKISGSFVASGEDLEAKVAELAPRS